MDDDTKHAPQDISDQLRERSASFGDDSADFDVLHSDGTPLYTGDMVRYVKRPMMFGFVRTTDVVPTDTELATLTLEGDSYFVAGADTYIMIGVLNELWPIHRSSFETLYDVIDAPRERDERFAPQDISTPTVRERETGIVHDITPNIRSCVSRGEVAIYARQLMKPVRIITPWSGAGYMHGAVGDFLVMRDDESHDIYVVERETFGYLYEQC